MRIDPMPPETRRPAPAAPVRSLRPALPKVAMALCVSIAIASSTPGTRAADTRGWLGIYHEPFSPLPPVGPAMVVEGVRFPGPDSGRAGLRVTAVWPDSPAELAGLEVGDIVTGVDGAPFACPAESVRAVFQRAMTPRQAGEQVVFRVRRDGVDRAVALDGVAADGLVERRFWRAPTAVLDSLREGQRLTAEAHRRQREFDARVTLGARPEAAWPPGKPPAEIYPAGRYPEMALAPLAWEMADSAGLRADLEDLLSRLGRCHETADPHRLEAMSYVHREPFRLESFARATTEAFQQAAGARELIGETAWLLAPAQRAATKTPSAAPSATPSDASLAESLRVARGSATAITARDSLLAPLLSEIETVLAAAAEHQRRAFSGLTEAERRFLAERRFDLSDAFAGEVYIHFDDDRERFGRNRRLIALAERVDYGELLAAAREASRLADPVWLRRAAAQIERAWSDSLERPVLYNQATPWGRIILGGTGRAWHREMDAAFLLDLGGNDFYTGNAGGSRGFELPISICVDLAGNDAYESTEAACQGSGSLGIGVLVDLAGDDQYIAKQWGQGTGYFGLGWVDDLDGRDIWRGRTFCQGVGLFGAGFLLDRAGDDRYEGDCQVQGVGLARGIGLLRDSAGNDEFYAKGLYPTGYGDAGIFDAWSQGVGIGFRTVASGGLGMLLDGGGRDRMEAGNFSQGGGYYYALGICRAFGREGDTYIGSRYNQGFTAHQAAGAFLEDGGDDLYTTRQAVAQGLAWDECITLFVDAGGNDTYQGGGGFSLGASAHNSVCLFVDRGGVDRYDYAPGPGLAGGNDYHGGRSLSVFVDEGGGADLYEPAAPGNDARRVRPEHGLVLDLPSTVDEAVRTGAWRRLRVVAP